MENGEWRKIMHLSYFTLHTSYFLLLTSILCSGRMWREAIACVDCGDVSVKTQSFYRQVNVSGSISW